MTTAPTNSSPQSTVTATSENDALMPTRMAGILGLVAFAYSLLAGLFEAGNTFSTIVMRAIVAMVGTIVVGYLIGWVAQVMLNENLRAAEAAAQAEETNPEISSKDSATDGR